METIKKFINSLLSFFEYNLIILMLGIVLFVMLFIKEHKETNINMYNINKSYYTIITNFVKEKNINVTTNELNEYKINFEKKYPKTKLEKENIELISLNKLYMDKLEKDIQDSNLKKEFKEKVFDKILVDKEKNGYKNYLLGME